MSGAMENRAAVFTDQPQAVEVYQAGTWWAGELLGWRHDANGSCQVWVRVVLGGVEETAWTDLASLRLPERHLAVAAGPTGPPAAAPGAQEMSVARHPSGRRARSTDADGAATAGLAMVRDLSVVPEPPSTGGRRTAEETAQFASVGRRRAPEVAEPPATGRRRAPETAESPSAGRRRAPETGESLDIGRRRAPEGAPARPAAPALPGRHRASGELGRHRTADTGMLAAVPQEASSSTTRVSPGPVDGGPSRPRPAVRPERGATRTGWTAPEGLEPELLTRPMRMSDHVPHARRPRVDGSVGG
ncbi:hypothetical protein [Blastococcus colisei]|uniref:hypothetical protein n=1 Tax=Blastococcus colisei TaxID=1564162 RepID=UPI00115143ED|nr:hypothetical protein [Blastococcus colisei]